MLIEYPPQHSEIKDDSVYGDYINHCISWRTMFVRGSKVTTTHESCHGINAEIRNKYMKDSRERLNSFYLGKNKAYVVKEPVGIRKSDVLPYIPRNMISSRYNLYIKGMQAWDDTPLYIYDEHTAYCAGLHTAIDLKNAERILRVLQIGPARSSNSIIMS